MSDFSGGQPRSVLVRRRRRLVPSIRLIFYLTTVDLWLVLSASVLVVMMENALSAPPGSIESYARSPVYQTLNFAATYLPVGVTGLAAVLVGEWLLFRLVERRFRRNGSVSGPPSVVGRIR